MPVDWVVVGLDNGGTTNNGTVLDSGGEFLLDQMAEVPSNVREGPDKAIQSLVDAVEHAPHDAAPRAGVAQKHRA